MVFEVLKGTKDYEPALQIVVNEVVSTLAKNFERHGFRPFETPTIEYFETLTNKYDEDSEIVQEIFKVMDRGGRTLGLRYDLTVPLCRYIAQKKQLKLPFRRYHVAKVFRDGPTKPGRSREFMQCDADVVGIEGVEVEAELLSMFYEGYKKLGINAILELNSNKILRGVFLQFGFEENDLQSLILSTDKLKKIGMDKVLAEMKSQHYDEERAKKALQLLCENDIKELREKAQNPLLVQGVEELSSLLALLDVLQVQYRVNLSMSRGLNIYTGNIWEAYDKDEHISSSIGSGGRYDNAIGNFIGDGRSFPAVGVSYGIVPVLECLKEKEHREGVTDILVIPLDESLVLQALSLAKLLREEEQNTEVFYGFKLKKAFDYADYLGIKQLAILGKKDIEGGVYTLRNLQSKEERKISFS